MILVDTSIWIDHFRTTDLLLFDFLKGRKILVHPFVIGEISLGNIANRQSVISSLRRLRCVKIASDSEVIDLIERQGMFGKGIGYVDAHLLASMQLTPGARLWSKDKRLAAIAESMGKCFNPDRLLN